MRYILILAMLFGIAQAQTGPYKVLKVDNLDEELLRYRPYYTVQIEDLRGVKSTVVLLYVPRNEKQEAGKILHTKKHLPIGEYIIRRDSLFFTPDYDFKMTRKL